MINKQKPLKQIIKEGWNDGLPTKQVMQLVLSAGYSVHLSYVATEMTRLAREYYGHK